jgi:hypothetical protein
LSAKPPIRSQSYRTNPHEVQPVADLAKYIRIEVEEFLKESNVKGQL